MNSSLPSRFAYCALVSRSTFPPDTRLFWATICTYCALVSQSTACPASDSFSFRHNIALGNQSNVTVSLSNTRPNYIVSTSTLLRQPELASNYAHRSQGHLSFPSQPSLRFIRTQHCSGCLEQCVGVFMWHIAFPIPSFPLIHSYTTLLWLSRAIVLSHFLC